MSLAFSWHLKFTRTAILVVLPFVVGLTPLPLLAMEPPTRKLTSTSSGTSQDEQDSDHERMQGNWKVETFINEGKKVPAPGLRYMLVVINDDSFTLRYQGAAQTRFHYTVKSKGDGAGELDTTHYLDDGKEITQLGIYEIKGDKLRLCIVGEGDPRPEDFEVKTATVFELLKSDD